jgi:triosephosphate isomerase
MSLEAQRRPVVGGNWKMNTTAPEAVRLADDVKRRIGRLRSVDMIVFPPAPFIDMVARRLDGERIAVGAQDIHPKASGAFTGAFSGPQVKSVGATVVLIGHSERRHVFGESDALIAEKLAAALAADLDVVLCVGETLAERDADRTSAVCERQLTTALAALDAAAMKRVIIAYEPVWAIGTGRTATPGQAQDVHRFIREWLGGRFQSDVASATRIQYGGSVKAQNAGELMAGPDLDGALVGGASLLIDDFAAIVQAVGQSRSAAA